MLLSYLDESYTKERYWIVGLMLNPSGAHALTAALDEIVIRASLAHQGVDADAELHGHPLMHGIGDWEQLKPLVRARAAIYARAMQAIGTHAEAIVVRGVDLHGLRERQKAQTYNVTYPPHKIVLEHLLERIDECAMRRKERALVICDEIDSADDYRHDLWHFQRYATSGYRSRRLTRIIDTMHFAPSNASRLVQAADLVAYLYQRIKSDSCRDRRAVALNAKMWASVSPLVAHEWCWLS